MFPQLKEDNLHDTCFVSVENCATVGEDHFPLSWNGVVPSEATLSEMYSKAHAGEM